MSEDRQPEPGSSLRTFFVYAFPLAALLAASGGLRLVLLACIVAGLPLREADFPFARDLVVAAVLAGLGLGINVLWFRSDRRTSASLILAGVAVVWVGVVAWLALSFTGGNV